MPEGPSIVILKEEVQAFKGKRVREASGKVKAFDAAMLKGKVIRDFKTWGKHFLICFDEVTVRIHLLMFGSYRINERHENREPMLHLGFAKGELNFYTCSVKLLPAAPDDVYDWTADVMNEAWSSRKAMKKLKENGDRMVCDALLDQEIFSGVGNIIKNEVLYRIHVQPESIVAEMPDAKLREMVKESVVYAGQFLEWKKAFTLKSHWLAHSKKTCKRCNLPLVKKHTGKGKRRSFFCPHCQVLYK